MQLSYNCIVIHFLIVVKFYYRFAYACGASYPLCSWLRVPKLLISYEAVFRGQRLSSLESKESSSRRRLTYLACIVFSIGHICACVWFYVGSQYVVIFLVLSILLMPEWYWFHCSIGIRRTLYPGIGFLRLSQIYPSLIIINLAWKLVRQYGSNIFCLSTGWQQH